MRYKIYHNRGIWYLVDVIKIEGKIWHYVVLDGSAYIGHTHSFNYDAAITHGWTIEEDKEHKVLEILRSYESKRNKVQK